MKTPFACVLVVLSLLLVAASCKLTGDGAKARVPAEVHPAVCVCEGDTFDTPSNGDSVPRCTVA